jgi:hypothetical protein
VAIAARRAIRVAVDDMSVDASRKESFRSRNRALRFARSVTRARVVETSGDASDRTTCDGRAPFVCSAAAVVNPQARGVVESARMRVVRARKIRAAHNRDHHPFRRSR